MKKFSSILIWFALMLCFPSAWAGGGENNLYQDHATIQPIIQKVDQLVGTLIYGTSSDSRQIKREIVTLLEKHLLPHAKSEENGLYAQADKIAGNERYAFTTRIRYEHQIIARRLKALADTVNMSSANDKVFARKADQLLGLITAHFEQEEKLILPLVKYGSPETLHDKP